MEAWSVGHSNRSIEDFIEVLQFHGIRAIADVRAFPGSRRLPHFNGDVLRAHLNAAGIDYRHMPELGGRRRSELGDSSPNNGWKNESFRAYADYMQTPEFEQALEEFIEYASQRPTALMCSEAVPWRCHRALIADALVVRGNRVRHVTGLGSPRDHTMPPFAVVDGDRITYPAPEGALDEDPALSRR